MKLKEIIQESGIGGFGEIQKEKMPQEQKKQLLVGKLTEHCERPMMTRFF